MCENLEGQLGWFDPDGLSGKTCQDASPPAVKEEQTSKRSCRSCAKLSAKRLPLFLSLKTDGLGQDASAEWVTAVAPFPSLGDYTMLSTGEFPREENASRLSQILEDCALPKYSLSERACMGILNRAKKRGKELPVELREALERQAGCSDMS